MGVLNRFISNMEKYICVATFVVMLTLTFVNVVSRKWLGMSLSFTEEIVTCLFVLASLAGASIAVRDHAHLGLDFITGYFSAWVQRALFVLANILGMAFCAAVVYEGVFMVTQEYESGQVSATMQWPEWIYGLTVPVGGTLLLIRYFITICQTVSTPVPEYADASGEGQA